MESGEISKQIKFAVVMYGGGSLAIYINGVAQELLKMVQATNTKPGTLTGTSIIYRKIALLLSDKKKFDALAPEEKRIAALSAAIAKTQDAQVLSTLKKELEDVYDQRMAKLLQNISVRFVIDVLTGSSAGGINAIYLSKALASGANMDELRDLWMTQGDFRVLLNDKKSVRDNSLLSPREPKSLLNSQRMYLELLKALHGMDEQPVKGAPMADVLDLFVTFTDFQGVPLPISMSNKRILERRHKQVFNFRYDEADKIDDFVPGNNPFLAFAARSTSAFPLAFEPMKLTDIDEVLKVSGLNYSDRSDSDKWKAYFRDVVDETGKSLEWKDRSFVDGGALDNKPFSYAIDTLAQREATGIVERKLLFIDPSPEEFKPETAGDKPDALRNLIGQGIGLPRYETIREDVEQLRKRNLIINRVKRITAQMEEDFDEQKQKVESNPEIIWSEVGLKEILKFKGPAFLLYYRLRINSVTDQITRMAGSYLRIDEESNYTSVVRCLISFWRDENFKKDKTDGKETLNNFLYLFDVDYRFRRLRFVMQKLELLMNCRKNVFEQLKKEIIEGEQSEKEESDPDPESMSAYKYARMYKKGFMKPSTALYEAFPYENEYKKNALAFLERLEDKDGERKFIGDLMHIQERFNATYSRLRREDNYVQEGMNNSRLAERLSTSDHYKTIPEKLEDLKNRFGDIEYVLRLFEIDKQIAEAVVKSRKNPETGDKTSENLRELKALLEARTAENILPDDKKSALKRLSLDALERINRELKKRSDDCKPVSENSSHSLLDEIFEPPYRDDIMKALNAAGESLDRLYGRSNDVSSKVFLGAASDNMKKLLGITPANDAMSMDELKEEIGKDAKVEDPDYSYFIRAYLRSYYLLFDNYDQLSFPIYFETSVGEAVEVDLVRVSSRDATSLINEGERKEDRRKLAGDYLYSFGAFLDARWRQNDIMWGRLDGAERLIETLLPGDDYKLQRDLLIREANETILNETLLQNASNTFSATVSKALTYAGVEAIDQQSPADRLFKGLDRNEISSGLLTALKQKLNPATICDDVKQGYEVDRVLEPQPTLQIISRATQIGGKILEGIADKQAQAGNRLRWIARLGSIFWGLVTVAAPGSMANLFFNYWLQLIYLFEVVVIVGATFLANAAVQQFGMITLVLTVVLNLTVLTLHDLMREKSVVRLLLAFAVILMSISAALGAVFIYAFVFNSKVWQQLHNWKTGLETGGWDAYSKLLFIAILGIFVAALFGWREARNQNIKPLGLIILLFTLAMIASGVVMESYVGNLRQPPGPVIVLEFAGSRSALEKIVTPTDLKVAEADNIVNLKTALFIDSFVFIPLYTLTFLLLAQLLAFRRAGALNTESFFFLLKFPKWRQYLDENAGKIDPEKVRLTWWEKAVSFTIFHAQNIWKKLFQKPQIKNQNFLGRTPWYFQRNSVWLAWIAVFIILGAAVADGVENYLSYLILDRYAAQAASDYWYPLKTNAAILKFSLIFIGLLILSLIWYRPFNRFRRRSDTFSTDGRSLIHQVWLPLLFILSLLPSLIGITLLALGHTFTINYMYIVLLLLLGIELIVAATLIKLDRTFMNDF
ncbi:MAG TPA: patatin-like protein [Pyrinomonadaceae bacterium]|jgi:patatin-related protein|nr:patatin-like protein [Pyrinomonadaceae bacterium]